MKASGIGRSADLSPAGCGSILFGVVAIFLGASGYTTTRDAIKDEGITFGTADDPAVAKYATRLGGRAGDDR